MSHPNIRLYGNLGRVGYNIKILESYGAHANFETVFIETRWKLNKNNIGIHNMDTYKEKVKENSLGLAYSWNISERL